jgi:hypothetical protein
MLLGISDRPFCSGSLHAQTGWSAMLSEAIAARVRSLVRFLKILYSDKAHQIKTIYKIQATTLRNFRAAIYGLLSTKIVKVYLL